MRVLLDTNVVSEMVKDSPNLLCKTWVDTYPRKSLYFSAPGEAELCFGIENKPMGKPRDTLDFKTKMTLQKLFNHRILPFDSKAALEYGNIKFTRQKIGKPVNNAIDLQMAAIARAYNLAIVTRNVKDFEHVGLKIINPWDDVTEIREVPAISYISDLAA